MRDALGDAVPGVTIVAMHQATRASRPPASIAPTADIRLRFPRACTVAATLAGFQRVVQVVQVEAAGSIQLDFTLQPSLSQEVTVTATKREQTLLNVPFSVAAPTEEVLRARGVDDIEASQPTCGLHRAEPRAGQSQVAMRGISAGQIVRDQPGVKEQVGVYLDESVISLSLFTPDLDLFDTNRVEVLRGPQGTLFGSGSLSGTVRYITNPPEIGVTKAFAELGVNGVDGGNAGFSGKVGFNRPWQEGRAAHRLVLRSDLGLHRCGPAGSPARTSTSTTGSERAASSPDLHAQRTTDHTPRLVYQRVGMNGWNRRDEYNILANPFTTSRPPARGGGRQFTQLEEEFTDDFVLVDVNLEHRFGDRQLTSITSYTHRDVLVVRDAGALTSSITGGSLGLPENVYTLDAPLDDATTADVWTEAAPGRRVGAIALGGRRVLQPHQSGLARTCSSPASNRSPASHTGPARRGRPVLLGSRLHAQSVRPVRRSHRSGGGEFPA